MESFINFFETMPSYQKLVWIFICLSISWLAEFAFPLIKFNYHKWRHAGVNIFFLVTSIAINLLFGLATAGIIMYGKEQGIGLFYMVSIPLWLNFVLSVMLLDFIAQWVAHYMLHKVKWMWKFHLVHHSDIYVDATTGTRHHPGDYLIREIFSLVTILIFGIPLAFYLFYRIATVFFTYLSHANITMPSWMEKILGLVFITPYMHKFHHHFERPWTDSNFGNIFSIWDRIFGTLVIDDPKKVHYGVDVLEDKHAQDAMYQLKVPFDKNIKTDY